MFQIAALYHMRLGNFFLLSAADLLTLSILSAFYQLYGREKATRSL